MKKEMLDELSREDILKVFKRVDNQRKSHIGQFKLVNKFYTYWRTNRVRELLSGVEVESRDRLIFQYYQYWNMGRDKEGLERGDKTNYLNFRGCLYSRVCNLVTDENVFDLFKLFNDEKLH